MTHEENTQAIEPETPTAARALGEAGENAPARPRIPLKTVQGDSTQSACPKCGTPTPLPLRYHDGASLTDWQCQRREDREVKQATAPRDLAAVIDAMLAEIPEEETGLRSDLLLAQHAFVDQGNSEALTLVDVAEALIRPGILTAEPWYERVMAIWSGEAASPMLPTHVPMGGGFTRSDFENSPTGDGLNDEEVETGRQRFLAEASDEDAFNMACLIDPKIANALQQSPLLSVDGATADEIVDFAASELPSIQEEFDLHPSSREILIRATRHMMNLRETSPTGDTPNLAGEAWAGEALAPDGKPWPTEPQPTLCADCGGQPDLVLLAQDCAKCVRCFILAGMKSQCFMCKQNPTEAIVRAIHPKDGKDDTVGCCVECLLKQVSAGRN